MHSFTLVVNRPMLCQSVPRSEMTLFMNLFKKCELLHVSEIQDKMGIMAKNLFIYDP